MLSGRPYSSLSGVHAHKVKCTECNVSQALVKGWPQGLTPQVAFGDTNEVENKIYEVNNPWRTL